MSSARSCRIHPTAIISPETELGEGVEIGAGAYLEGRIKLGDGCVIRPYAVLIGPLTMGPNNIVHSFAVLGDAPQHLKYQGEPTGVAIGESNTFREHVTVHRATTASWTTRIGNHNLFMASSHVAHDCQIGNHCIVANGALIAGHVVLGDNVVLSGNCAIHQFVRLGRLSLLSGCAITGKDIPPFIMQQGINCVVGVNVVGMRRAGMTERQITPVREAFRMIYADGGVLKAGLERAQAELGHIDVVAEMLDFIRQSKRGINGARERDRAA
jgi:UDP-N-acetylglucosamine acyltransferase